MLNVADHIAMPKWKNPCKTKTPKCVCAEKECNHVCCGAVRGHKRQGLVKTLMAARADEIPDTPGYNYLTRRMYSHGFDDPGGTARCLQDDFNDTLAPSAMDILGAGMKDTLRSQEREHDLNRLIATIPPLDQAADVYLAMNFFYRTQCEAKTGDVELRFKAAIHRCSVVRFTNILRQAPFTAQGWDNACVSILTSIDRHYLSSAWAALGREMKQHLTEDPSLYADRVMMRTDIYKHFAELRGKTVDEEEIARKWINGLNPRSVKMAAAVAVASSVSYPSGTRWM